MAVVVAGVGSSVGSSSRGSVDNGLRGYGFVRSTDRVRISRGGGLQDYGLFSGLLVFVTARVIIGLIFNKLIYKKKNTLRRVGSVCSERLKIISD